jgi:hypothetical protein
MKLFIYPPGYKPRCSERHVEDPAEKYCLKQSKQLISCGHISIGPGKITQENPEV